ncbi:hypothetical protein [Streptomyces sp. YS415]
MVIQGCGWDEDVDDDVTGRAARRPCGFP